MLKSDNWVDKYGQSFMDFPLKNLKFKKEAWISNDHEHCLFCGKEITNCAYDYTTERQGYASVTECWWACQNCFETFCKKYNLPVIKNTVKMVEDTLSEYKTIVFSLKNKQYTINNNGKKIIVKHNEVVKEYDSIITMEREQLFYGKYLRDIIEELFVGIV